MKRKIKLNFMKKNQVVVAVTGLMLIAAGYLNYTNNEQTNSYIEVGSLADSMDMAEIGDAKLASTNASKEDKKENEASSNVVKTENTVDDKNSGNTVQNSKSDDNKKNEEKRKYCRKCYCNKC